MIKELSDFLQINGLPTNSLNLTAKVNNETAIVCAARTENWVVMNVLAREIQKTTNYFDRTMAGSALLLR